MEKIYDNSDFYFCKSFFDLKFIQAIENQNWSLERSICSFKVRGAFPVSS